MGRPSNASERRLQIVEATLRVMARTGFDGASVQAIAKEAGLAAGLLHHHFGNKAEILHALLDHLEVLVTSRYERQSARRRGAWGRLEAWIDAHLAQGDDAEPDAVAAWVWIGAQALKDDDVRERYRAVVERRLQQLTALLHEVAREHDVRVDAQGLAVLTLATIEGYYQLAASTKVVPPGSAAPELRRSLRRTLTGRRG
ncbi:TetR family transcriptional regulator [Paraliomyxa miuraensis]|uniref:TetR family transcriptional regulator n=1 Tax=Paraliomyxa miuraensis TaxID=376150 RepID=UPI002251678E|nr:TetR family transcriptional regulator [Paraliomyxa miuraensis]MCX4241648.1 TetR family transcriptional regulator [Paraliomyxa miuraensis]